MSRASLTLMVTMLSATLSAHVTVTPTESPADGPERYTVRVPSEGKVSTSVELEIPPNVTITGVLVGAGFTYETRRDGNRVVAITWTRDVKVGEIAEFVFFARNPAQAGTVAWKAHQHYADGSTADWTGVEGDLRPASVTRITPAVARPRR
jgi:uncharacterized protein YcnI